MNSIRKRLSLILTILFVFQHFIYLNPVYAELKERSSEPQIGRIEQEKDIREESSREKKGTETEKTSNKAIVVSNTSIQDLIDEASPGTKVVIPSDTYNFTGGNAAFISKPLTLRCEIGTQLIGDGTGTGVLIQSNDVTVENCDIQNFHYGIIANSVVTQPETLKINSNLIHGNLIAGIHNRSGGEINVEKNGWGTPDGPSGIASGSGDALLGQASYCPWINNGNLTNPNYSGSCLGTLQGRTFIDINDNGLLLSTDGDYPDLMLDGFTVRLYSSDWDLLDEQTTRTTSNIGQYQFTNLLAENTSYYVCGVQANNLEYSYPAIGQQAVKTDGNPVTKYAYAEIVSNSSGVSDESPVCWSVELTSSKDTGAYLGIGYDKNAPDTPTQTGYNEDNGDPASTPRDPNVLACSGEATKINGVSVHWTDESTGYSYYDDTLLYQRQYNVDNGFEGNEIYSNPYTNYRSFGGGQGTEGTYGSRVRAFYDLNGTGTYDTGEPASDWSNLCSITYDITDPEAPTNFDTKITHNADQSGALNYDFDFNESTSSDIDYYVYQYSSYDLETGQHFSNSNVELSHSGYGNLKNCNINDSNTGERCNWEVETQNNRVWINRVRAVDKAGNMSNWSNWNDLSFTEFKNIPKSDIEYKDWVNKTGAFSGDYKGGNYIIRENVAPKSTIITADPSTPVYDQTYTFNYTYSDNYTEVKNVTLYVEKDGVLQETLPLSISNTSYTYTFDDALGDGNYCFYTIAEDFADDGDLDNSIGNLESFTQCDLILTKIIDLQPTVEIDVEPGTTVEESTEVFLNAIGTGGNGELTYLWGGDCEGDQPEVSILTKPGTYTCSVTVTDANGDTATSIVDIFVKALVLDENQQVSTPVVSSVPRVIEEETESVVQGESANRNDNSSNNTDSDGEVKGYLTCENLETLSGYVFVDNNQDGNMDDNDKGEEDVEVQVSYTDEGGDIVILKTLTTDEEGYWEIEICPGEYDIEVVTEYFDGDKELQGDQKKTHKVEEDKENQINFILKAPETGSDGLNWWLILIPLGLILVISAFIIYMRERTPAVQYQENL